MCHGTRDTCHDTWHRDKNLCLCQIHGLADVSVMSLVVRSFPRAFESPPTFREYLDVPSFLSYLHVLMTRKFDIRSRVIDRQDPPQWRFPVNSRKSREVSSTCIFRPFRLNVTHTLLSVKVYYILTRVKMPLPIPSFPHSVLDPSINVSDHLVSGTKSLYTDCTIRIPCTRSGQSFWSVGWSSCTLHFGGQTRWLEHGMGGWNSENMTRILQCKLEKSNVVLLLRGITLQFNLSSISQAPMLEFYQLKFVCSVKWAIFTWMLSLRFCYLFSCLKMNPIKCNPRR